MSMDRKGFLRSLALGAAGLIVGEQALEAFARLTHVRKSFPSAAIWGKFPPPWSREMTAHYMNKDMLWVVTPKMVPEYHARGFPAVSSLVYNGTTGEVVTSHQSPFLS